MPRHKKRARQGLNPYAVQPEPGKIEPVRPVIPAQIRSAERLSLEKAGAILEQHRPQKLPLLAQIAVDKPLSGSITKEHFFAAGFKPMILSDAMQLEKQLDKKIAAQKKQMDAHLKVDYPSRKARSFKSAEAFAAFVPGVRQIGYNPQMPSHLLYLRERTSYETIVYRPPGGQFKIFIGYWGFAPKEMISQVTIGCFLEGAPTRIINPATLEQCLLSGRQFGIYPYEVTPAPKSHITVFEIVPI